MRKRKRSDNSEILKDFDDLPLPLESKQILSDKIELRTIHDGLPMSDVVMNYYDNNFLKPIRKPVDRTNTDIKSIILDSNSSCEEIFKGVKTSILRKGVLPNAPDAQNRTPLTKDFKDYDDSIHSKKIDISDPKEGDMSLSFGAMVTRTLKRNHEEIKAYPYPINPEYDPFQFMGEATTDIKLSETVDFSPEDRFNAVYNKELKNRILSTIETAAKLSTIKVDAKGDGQRITSSTTTGEMFAYANVSKEAIKMDEPILYGEVRADFTALNEVIMSDGNKVTEVILKLNQPERNI